MSSNNINTTTSASKKIEDKEQYYKDIVKGASILKCLANERRLLILCKLNREGECTAGELSDFVETSPSAVSQHLAIMKELGIVKFRKKHQAVYYSIADTETKKLILVLHELYCKK